MVEWNAVASLLKQSACFNGIIYCQECLQPEANSDTKGTGMYSVCKLHPVAQLHTIPQYQAEIKDSKGKGGCPSFIGDLWESPIMLVMRFHLRSLLQEKKQKVPKDEDKGLKPKDKED